LIAHMTGEEKLDFVCELWNDFWTQVV